MTYPTRRILVIEGNVPAMRDLTEALGADVRHISAADVIAGKHGLTQAPDCVVIGIAGEDRTPGALVTRDIAHWTATADDPQFELLRVLQTLRAAFAGQRWSVVLVGADLGLTGARRQVALATATEGQRGMMKSLARQWGPDVRFTWLAVSTRLLFPEIAEEDLAEQPELGAYMPSLARRPTIDDVAQLVLTIGSSPALFLTGQTLNMDGGEWMLP